MSFGPNSTPLDPALLAAFRQQGAPIVARERGISPACRIKLAGVARGLGIADHQIEQAIRSLAVAEPTAPPNPEAERFRLRLQKDLSGKSRTIIGPTIEARILSAAKRKYGLEADVAAQVLGEVAAELGLTRITASAAIQSLAAQIDQAAGDSTWLAREAWDRLRSAGVKWGLELEVIDEMIDERLAANRSEYSRRNIATRATLYVAAGGVTVAALVIAGLLFVRSAKQEAAPAASTAMIAPRRPTAKTPPWWDVDLSVEMVHAKTAFGGPGGIYDSLASSSGSERAAGYERLLEQVRAAPQQRELLPAATRIFAGCYMLESDDNAALRLQKGLIALLPATDAPLPEPSGGYSSAFWAADAAASALHRRGGKSDRRTALADALGVALGAVIDPAAPAADCKRLLREHTALAAYRQLATAAAKHPGQVAALYAALAQRAAATLPDDELLRSETALLAAVLPAIGSDWQVFQRPIVRCIAAPDPLPSLRLADALRRIDDPDLIAYLSELLIVRSGARPKSLAKKDVVAAVRTALGGGASLTAADRWLTLQDEARSALASSAANDQGQLLDQIVELAHLTTLAVALAQGDAGFAAFDALVNQPPESLAKRDTTSESPVASSPASSRPAARPLAKGRQRDLSRSIDQLNSRGPATHVERESALRTLVGLSIEAADISPQQAAQIAAYLLADKRPDEQEKAVAALGELRRWKRLRLAIADGLANSKLTAAQQVQIINIATGRSIAADSSSQELRRLLLADVVNELEAETGPGSTAGGDSLVRAAELLAANYGQRAALLGVSSASISPGSSPAQILEAALAALMEKKGLRDPAGDLSHELKAARYLAGDALHGAAAVQRMLVDVSARRLAAQRPAQAAAARKIAAESLATFVGAENVLVQLRDQEAALLKLWMLYAPEA